MGTTHLGIAGIGGARVGVVARKGCPCRARAILARVAGGACTAVVARRAVGDVDTPLCRVAHIGGAGVGVIAGLGVMHHAVLLVAVIVGARVAVVRVDSHALAHAARAGVARCARTAVVARRSVVRVRTTLLGVAGIVGARVIVVTVDCLAHALSFLARVAGGACTSVRTTRPAPTVAGFGAVRTRARLGVAGVFRARVLVVAVRGILTLNAPLRFEPIHRHVAELPR